MAGDGRHLRCMHARVQTSADPTHIRVDGHTPVCTPSRDNRKNTKEKKTKAKGGQSGESESAHTHTQTHTSGDTEDNTTATIEAARSTRNGVRRTDA